MAHVAMILANGEDWFRELGTEASPGTIVCTVSGATERAAVGEVAMGTPLSTVIQELGGGVTGGISMVLPGVSNRIIPPADLDVPLTYEAMADLDTGLGTAGFIVVGEGVDPVAVAHGVARFLSVESCGQCRPCKEDGRRMTGALDRIRTREALGTELHVITSSLGTVEDGARCFLATQQRVTVASLLRLFSSEVQAEATEAGDEVPPFLVTELLDIRPDGSAVYDEHHAAKQPDWTYDDTDSGQAPADRLRRSSVTSS
jgi:NADH:ubiquinone oxidoreductase subunit F (NADH-binding)